MCRCRCAAAILAYVKCDVFCVRVRIVIEYTYIHSFLHDDKIEVETNEPTISIPRRFDLLVSHTPFRVFAYSI